MNNKHKTLDQIAKERGFPSTRQLLTEAVQDHEAVAAMAKSLGVYPNALYNWANENGYEFRRTLRLNKRKDGKR